MSRFSLSSRSLAARFARLAVFGSLAVLPVAAHAQLNSNSVTVTLNATLGETLTIASNVTNVNFALNAGSTATGATAVQITTNWVLKSTRSAVNLYGWFATPAAALTDGGSPANNIASSLVFGQVTTGSPTSYTAFTQSNALGTASGGLQLYTQAISNTNRNSSRIDNLNLQINLTTLPQLPAGTYTGILNLQAQAL